MITLGPTQDLRVQAGAGALVVADGNVKPVGNNPPAYQKLTTTAGFVATGGVDTLFTASAGFEIFVKELVIVNLTGAPINFQLFRDGTTANFRYSIIYVLPDSVEAHKDDVGWYFINVNGQRL